MNTILQFSNRLLNGCFVAGIAFLGIATQNTDDFEIAKNLEIFSNVYKEVHTHYVDQLEPEKVMRYGLNAMLSQLDPYTSYISPEEVEQFQSTITGRYGGVGSSVIQYRDGKIAIAEVYENSPAHKAGLRAGDILVTANGHHLQHKTTKDVSLLLRGTAQTEVTVEVKRPHEDKIRKIVIKREDITVSNIPYFGMLNENTGYIVLSAFSENAGKNVASALMELKSKYKVQNLIFDLRGNSGGLLNEAVNVSNIFIPKNELIVQIKGRDIEQQQTYKTLNQPIDNQINLAVLIDNNSASASEIVAGAIQDLDRGVVIGERSYGKGLVQNTRDIAFGAKVKITTARYYIPSGRCIQATKYKDGVPIQIADSLRTTFKTKRGRKVQDGGGITPDLVTTEPNFSKIISSFEAQHLLFDFATAYQAKHNNIPAAKDFALTDSDFSDFIEFLKQKSYSYATDTDKLIKDLEAKARTEQYYDLVKNDIESMKKELEAEKAKLLQTYKKQILHLLQTEIVRRYYFERGSLESGIKTDVTIAKALELFQNPTEYNKILGK